jgi:hypothetical protein
LLLGASTGVQKKKRILIILRRACNGISLASGPTVNTRIGDGSEERESQYMEEK